MARLWNPKGRGAVRANAVVRLCSAREELWRAEHRHANACGTPAESWTMRRVGEAAAEVATREQWLHWIDRGTSIRPDADGEWGRPPDDQPSGNERRVGGEAGVATALRRPGVVRATREPRLRSDT